MNSDQLKAASRAAFWRGFHRGVTQFALVWLAFSLMAMPWLIRMGC